MMYPFAISFDGRENPREAVAHVLRQTSVGRDLFAIGWNAAMQFQKSAAFSQSRALPMPVSASGWSVLSTSILPLSRRLQSNL